MWAWLFVFVRRQRNRGERTCVNQRLLCLPELTHISGVSWGKSTYLSLHTFNRWASAKTLRWDMLTGIERSRSSLAFRHTFSVFMKVGYLRKKSFFTRFFAQRTAERKEEKKTLSFGRFGLKQIVTKHLNHNSFDSERIIVFQ